MDLVRQKGNRDLKKKMRIKVTVSTELNYQKMILQTH